LTMEQKVYLHFPSEHCRVLGLESQNRA